MQNDYLKYWRVVRYFIKIKYGISTGELDMLLFLYSEKYFGKEKFKEFNELLSWNVNRFDQLLKKGWIEVFRKRVGKHKTLYSLSFKYLLAAMFAYADGYLSNVLFAQAIPAGHILFPFVFPFLAISSLSSIWFFIF